MPRLAILFLGILLCRVTTSAQVSPDAPQPPPAANRETKRPIPIAAELALDAARRWTQSALDDASNLPSVERDFLLVRIAKAWNSIDHAKAEQYLKEAIEHLDTDTSPKSTSQLVDATDAISDISSDVMAVDRGAWNGLVDRLPSSSDASDAIATEAQTLADKGDPEGAMELERKSLEHGGSSSDLETLYSLIGANQSLASELFDEILKTASDPKSNTDLLDEFLRRLNSQADDAIGGFFNQERRQRLADVVAQRTLAGNHDDACNYSLEAAPLLSQYSAGVQGQFRSIVNDCQREGAYGPHDPGGATLNSTDDLVRGMNESADAHVKAGLRRRAAMHAAHVDENYERAIQLCLDASPQERAFDRFDIQASNLAWQAVSTSLRKNDDLEFQRVLAVLPPSLKAQVEVNGIRFRSKDKVRSLLTLSDARSILEHEVPPQTITYFFMLSETAQLAPEEMNISWRVLGSGLNRFAQKMRDQSTSSTSANPQAAPAYVNPISPWPLPQEALADEGLVRAIAGDLTSPEFRACLRLSVIQAFLARYTDARKETQSNPAASMTAVKH